VTGFGQKTLTDVKKFVETIEASGGFVVNDVNDIFLKVRDNTMDKFRPHWAGVLVF
jgi:hypothetical protein